MFVFDPAPRTKPYRRAEVARLLGVSVQAVISKTNNGTLMMTPDKRIQHTEVERWKRERIARLIAECRAIGLTVTEG